MAYVVSISSSQESVATTDFLMSNPLDIQVGDLLVAMCSRDNTTGSITSNWTIPAGGNITAGSIRMACAYLRVTSLPADLCTFTNASSDEWAGCVFLIRDYYYDTLDSDCIDVVGNNNDTAGPPYQTSALNVNYANSLILTAVGVDTAVIPVPSGGNFVVEDAQDAGTVSFVAGWTVCPVDTTVDQISFAGTLTNNNVVFLQFAIRNATNGRVPAYPASTIHDIIDTGYHRERAGAYTNETTTANFLGWDSRDPDYVYQDDGGVFTDFTTAATNNTDADVSFPATEVVSDAIYVGDADPFGSFIFDRAGCTQGAAGVLAYEYWNGSTWVAVPKKLDLTTNLNAAVADRQVATWRIPTNWATTTVNAISAYWIRMRITTVYTTNPTISRIRVAERGVVYDALGSVADTGINPFWSSIATSPANTYIGCHTGGIRDLGTSIDLDVSERYLVGTYIFSSPREYYDTGAADLGYGVRMPWMDVSNNYRSWIVGGFAFPQCAGDKRNIWAIQFSQTIDTSHDQGASSPDFNTTRKWVLCQGSFADEVTNIYHSYIAFANRAIINGGDDNGLANWSDIKKAINGTMFPYYSNGQMYIPIQFGGDKACKIDCNLATFDFIKVAGSTYGGMIHVDEGILGVIINAASGDIIKIRNSTITSESAIRFEVDASSSATATYDFSGTTVVNANVTLRNVGDFENMNFIDCPSFTQNGAPLISCSFTDTKVLSDNPENISNSSFTNTIDDHGIEISATGTFDLTDNTYTGYGADGTTSAAIYNNSGGAVVLNILGGDTPTIRNGASASTTVNVSAELELTGLQLNSEVRAYVGTDPSTAVEIGGTENSGTTFSFSHSVPTQDGYIVIHALNYEHLILNLTYSSSFQSIQVQQRVDRNYNNP